MNQLIAFRKKLQRYTNFLLVTSSLMVALSIAYSIFYNDSLALYFQIGLVIVTSLLIALSLYLKSYPFKDLETRVVEADGHGSTTTAYRTLQAVAGKISNWRKVIFAFNFGILILMNFDGGVSSLFFFITLSALAGLFIAILYQIEKSATKNLNFLRLEQ